MYRWLDSVGGGVGAMIGIMIARQAHMSYPIELSLIALFAAVFASAGARIGRKLEQRRIEAEASI